MSEDEAAETTRRDGKIIAADCRSRVSLPDITVSSPQPLSLGEGLIVPRFSLAPLGR